MYLDEYRLHEALDKLEGKIDRLEGTVGDLKEELRRTNHELKRMSEINDKLDKLLIKSGIREQSSLASQVLDGDGVPKSDFHDNQNHNTNPSLKSLPDFEDLFK